MFLCRVACLFLMLHAASAGAQDTPFAAPSGSRPIVDPDGTYVFNHVPSSNLIFEAQIAPRIVIRDSLGDATRRLLAAVKRPVWGWQLSATPMVRLRVFNEESSPVRTPSYMPKATVQIARFRNRSAADASDEDEFSKGPVEMWLVDVIPFGHHSNGQKGCLFTSQSRDAAGVCVESARPQARAINTTDGSFSTNYVEAMVRYGRMHLDAERAPETEYATRWEWRAGAGVQLNPKGYLAGAIDDELADIYGPTRVILEAAWQGATSGGAAAPKPTSGSSSSTTRQSAFPLSRRRRKRRVCRVDGEGPASFYASIADRTTTISGSLTRSAGCSSGSRCSRTRF